MKFIIRIILMFIMSVYFVGCTYEYHMPDDYYVGFKFKIDAESMKDICRLYVIKNGYYYHYSDNGAYIIEYYNDTNEVIGTETYSNNLCENEKVFTTPRGCKYFEIKMNCFGWPKAGSSKIECVCTILIKQSISELKELYLGSPYVFSFTERSISKIENLNPSYSLYLQPFSFHQIESAIKDKGYSLGTPYCYLYRYNSLGEIERISGYGYMVGEKRDYVITGTGVGIYCDCYSWGSDLICRIYSKVESCEFIQANSSSDNPFSFEIDHITYMEKYK